MDRIEWTHSADSLRDYESQQAKAAELATSPILDRLVKKVELPTDLKETRIPAAEAVINKVVELAENNHTMERILERKHEVKDFAAAETQKVQYASRLGEFIARQNNTSLGSSIVRNHNESEETGVLRGFINSNSLYAYAIKYGFISAVLSLVIAIMVVTLFT